VSYILLLIAFVLFIEKECASFVMWLWLQAQCSGPMLGRFGSQTMTELCSVKLPVPKSVCL